jgi:hypothetical protein
LIGEGLADAGTAAPNAAGDCRLGADSAVVGDPIHVFVPNTTDDVISHAAVSDPLPAGKHILQFGCNEAAGDLRVFDPELSAVLIGSG